MRLAEFLELRAAPGAGVALALTGRCPLRCAHCSTDSTPLAAEPPAAALRAFAESFAAAPRPPAVALLTGGEPLLRPRLVEELAARCRAAGTAAFLLTGLYFARTHGRRSRSTPTGGRCAPRSTTRWRCCTRCAANPGPRACLAVADPITRDLGLGPAQAFGPLFGACVDMLDDRLEEARRGLRESRAAAERLGDSGLAATAGRSLTRVLLMLGRYDDAAEELGRGDGGPAQSPVDTAETDGVRARIAAHRGDGVGGLVLADRAVAAADRTDCPAAVATAHLDRAHVLAALGRTAEAAAAARTARAGFTRKSHRPGAAWAAALLTTLE